MEDKIKELELRLDRKMDETIKDYVHYPLYMNYYEDAFRSFLMDFLRKEDLGRDYGDMPVNASENESANIVPVIGGRGTGKTTFTLELCKIFEGLSNRQNYLWWLNRVIPEESMRSRLENEQFAFHVFPRLDVSTLENKEDVFELVMAMMFRLFDQKRKSQTYTGDMEQNKKYEKLNRKILRSFEYILKGYYAIRDSRENEFADSYLAKLDYVSNSLDIGAKISELIKDIFSMEMGRAHHYMVVVLDDLDLNIEQGYEVLKQMQKFFSNNHMVIIFTADYELLRKVCYVHYVKAFSAEKSHYIEERVDDFCWKLAHDYMIKALPITKRLYMPNFRDNAKDILVQESSGASSLPVKHYVMKQIAQKLNVYYDIKGIKAHFAEPDNVRKLVNYDKLFKEMYDIDFDAWQSAIDAGDWEKCYMYMERYDDNHERMNMDIVNRLASRLLSLEQKKVFEGWFAVNLERRAEEAARYMYDELPSYEHEENFDDTIIMDSLLNQGHPESSRERERDSFSYGYGGLIEGIYRYGRLQPENKALVKCLLASLSSEMVREYISFSRSIDENKKNDSRRKLRKLLGNVFGNEWLCAMVPGRMEDGEYKDLGANGERKALGVNLFIIPKIDAAKLRAKNIKVQTMKFLRELMEELKKEKLVGSVEWLLLFTNFYRSGESAAIKISEAEAKETAIELSGMKEGVTFLGIEIENYTNLQWSILEFIPSSFCLDEYLERLHKELCQAIWAMAVSTLGFSNMLYKEEAEKEILAWIKEQSLFKGYDMKQPAGSIFPFYQVDYAYNVLKRARRELMDDNPELCERFQFLDYVGKAYKKLSDKMADEERVYRNMGIQLEASSLFEEFPFVSMMLDRSYKNTVNERVIDLVKTIFWGPGKAQSSLYAESD